jgi:hypothetical protein
MSARKATANTATSSCYGLLKPPSQPRSKSYSGSPEPRQRPTGLGMTATIAFVLVLLAGCSAQEQAHIYPGLFSQRIVGNDAYVTISNVWNEMDALPLAEQHCRQYNKSARFSQMIGARAVYDCVKS